MSMSAEFVQVEEDEAKKIKADPSLAEALFEEPSTSTAALAGMTKMASAMQERVKTVGPQMLAQALSRFDPKTRQMLEERLGRTTASLASGEGGNELLKLMEARGARAAAAVGMAQTRSRQRLSLDKQWHGVHYLLCGQVEKDGSVLSHAVMGGDELGEGEGFSGYGPARLLAAEKVKEISSALNRAELQAEASARFDVSTMNKLGIYPGFWPSDLTGLMEAFGQLREFYAEAAGSGRAIITCIV